MQRTVAIVGRPNVGKSALFNRLAGKEISLVYDRPGVTRDRVTYDIRLGGIPCLLVDTGGLGLDEGGFEEAIQAEVEIALSSATDIIFVVDGREGLHVLDTEVAKRLRKSKSNVVLTINKVDHDEAAPFINEFKRLGFKKTVVISAAHGRGTRDLVSAVIEDWAEEEEDKDQAGLRKQPFRIALVGKPNVGKSSLVNALLNEDRVIVSPIAGTTRDSVDTEFEREGERYSIIDTAGLRRRSKLKDPLEAAMGGRTAHAINRSQVCMLMLDADRGPETQDLKIASLIRDADKPCIIVVNKWDLAPASEEGGSKETGAAFKRKYQESVRETLFFLNYAPLVFISAANKNNLGSLFKAVQEINESRKVKMGTGPLNRILIKSMEQQTPPRSGGRIFKIYYATQRPADEGGIPTIVAFVNDPKLLTEPYRRYMEANIRKEFPLTGCPIRWELRAKTASDSYEATTS